MAKVLAKFNAIPVNPEIDPTGGCRLSLTDRTTYDEATVFTEAIDTYKLPMPADTLEYLFKAVLRNVATKTAADCKIRKIGNILSIRPTLRGKVSGPYSKFGSGDNNRFAVFGKLLSGVATKVDMSKVSFVNAHTGTRVRLDRISWIGADDGNVIKVGEPFAAYGTNMQYAASLGDSAVVTWEDGSGVERTAQLTCTESDYAHMRFAWPEGAALEAGMSVKVTITSRAGIDGNYAQVNSKTVDIIAA